MINEMTSLTYSKLELLSCLHFPMAATGINKEGCHFDVSSGPFKWPGMILSVFLKFILILLKSKRISSEYHTAASKQLIKYIECSNLLVRGE